MHQVALVSKKMSLKACGRLQRGSSGNDHTNKMIRVCNTIRSKGATRKVRATILKMDHVTDAERDALQENLRRAFTKPMRGRWGSMAGPRKRIIGIATCTTDRKIFAKLFRQGLAKYLNTFYRQQKADAEAPVAIQDEEEDVSKTLATRVGHSVTDLEDDGFYCDLIIAEVCDTEPNRCLFWMQKVLYDDNTPIQHVRQLASGKAEEWVARSLERLDFARDEWAPLKIFLDNDGPDKVTTADAHTSIMCNIMLVTMEFWRRFVLVFREPPFPLVDAINASEPYSEPSETRWSCVYDFITACWRCLGVNNEDLRDILLPWLLLCLASEGRLEPAIGEFLERFFGAFPFHTQDVEGKNSKIRRAGWLARHLRFKRMASRMIIGESPEISYEEYLRRRHTAAHAAAKQEFPFTPDRFAAVDVEVLPRTVLPLCPHQSGPLCDDAAACASYYDNYWRLGDIIKIGQSQLFFYCGFHYDRSGIARVHVANPSEGRGDDAGAAAAGEWPNLVLRLGNLEDLFGQRWRLDLLIADILRDLGPEDSVPVETGWVQWDLHATPPFAPGSSLLEKQSLRPLSITLAGSLREEAEKKKRAAAKAAASRRKKKKEAEET